MQKKKKTVSGADLYQRPTPRRYPRHKKKHQPRLSEAINFGKKIFRAYRMKNSHGALCQTCPECVHVCFLEVKLLSHTIY